MTGEIVIENFQVLFWPLTVNGPEQFFGYSASVEIVAIVKRETFRRRKHLGEFFLLYHFIFNI